MHRIGAFSKLSKVTVKALRYYDEVGLLKPAHVDRDTGYRLYTTAQLISLQRIAALRQAGLSIDEVSAVLSGQDGAAILRRRREEMRWERQCVEGARECYIDGCWNKEDPAEYPTELQFPVRYL